MQYIECGQLFDSIASELQSHVTLVVDDAGRITTIERGFRDHSSGGEIIDLRAHTVMPGLVDGHDHFGIDMGDGEPQAAQDPQWRVVKGVKNARAMLASGITTLRNAGEKHQLGLHIRHGIEAGWIVGPRVVLSGTPISSTGGHGWFIGVEADGPDAVRRAVRENVKDGVEMIKMIVTGGVTTPGGTMIRVCFTEPEIRAAVDETHLADKRIGVHCYGGDAATWAIEAGVDSIEHGTYLTDKQLDAMVERGTFLVSTSSVMRAAGQAPHVVPFMRERFKKIGEDYVDLLTRARARGVRLAVGCDTHHASLHEEIGVLLEAGYSSAEALRAATIGGARLCRMDDRVGTLEPGKFADLLAVDGDLLGDPVQTLAGTIKGVFKGGQRQPV